MRIAILHTSVTLLMTLLCFYQSIAQPISAEQNYARNSPGIVMVQAVFSATVYVNRVEINERAFDRLVDSVKRLDTTGTILSQANKLDIVIKALNKTPLRFFASSDEYFRQAHRVQSMGTGFIVSSDGYVITNSHIVDRDSAFIRNKFILSTFQEVTESNIDALQSSWAITLNDQQRSILSNTYGLIYSQVSSMILFDLKKEYFVLYRTDNVTGRQETIKKPADIVIKGKSMPGKDVAILKIEEIKELPVLTLSADAMVRIGTEVLVFGYPEPATTNSFLSSQASIDPSLTTGIVSAIKESIGGWPVIQMDAVISHGSSGSPVCNNKGEVIGLATFGSFDQGGGALASGFNFAIPVSVVKEFMDSIRLKPIPGKASGLFNEGLNFFYQQFYRKASEKFEEVRQLNSNYPQLNYYLLQSREKITTGNDQHFPPRQYVFWIMIVIAVVAGIYLFNKMRLKKYKR